MNYTDTLNYIHSLGNFSKKPTLNRIKAVLEVLDNPQNKFSSIHIAGTNGKGSVSAMLSCVLRQNRLKTGLFISPYIVNFRERIQINGQFISEDELCELAKTVIATKIELTEFEFITAVAFLCFAKENCDIAVIETGLGGRFDATNVLTNLKASVITKIGLDHTQVLGDTIEKITKEKCGIIKKAPLITSHGQVESAFEILKNFNPVVPQKEKLEIIKSDALGNEFIYDGVNYKTALSGEYQIENALIVIETALMLGIDTKTLKKALKTAFFPARMEIISKKPLVVLDGAHNADGAFALSGVMQKYKGEITALIGMCKDKDCNEVLNLTLPYCKRAIAVEIENMPRSLQSQQLCDLAQKYCKCETAESYSQALEKLKGEDTVFVFGSLYLASAVREKLKNFYKN